MTATRCLGALMAGGAARRFGGAPKGLATLGGSRLADLALGALRATTERQIVIANDPRAPGWFEGTPVVADDEPGLGPLGGLRTALRAADGDAVLVVAWDMPFVSADLLSAMRRLGESGGGRTVAPRRDAGAPLEPLCAYYPSRTLAECERLLKAGERRAASLIEHLPDAVTFTGEALRALGDPAHLLHSVDTPEALAALGGRPPGGIAPPARR